MHSLQSRARVTGLLAALAAGPAGALTLYDAALGTLPAAQGWLTAANAGAAGSQAVAGGVYTLDTTGAGVVSYGSGTVSPLALNTATGFTLTLNLRVLSESHAADNQRAGYSVIVVGANPGQALELAFWSDHIWAYGYDGALADPFFHSAEDVAFDTTAALRSYTLTVANQLYTLGSGGATLLTGALHNYAASGIAPYIVPNAVFFGDDSSRGSSLTQLGQVSVIVVPEPTPAALLAAGLVLLGWRCLGASRQDRPALTPAAAAAAPGGRWRRR